MRWLAVALLVSLAGCGTFEDTSRVPADAPAYLKGSKNFPGVKIGKPYEIAGERYYPKYEPDYDEVGIASWYGPNFHGKSTANGEKYNQWAMTAAHKTLPLPSMVRVTRVDNGESIIVRVNDRGPFSEGRIIDLSRAAAEALGTHKMGLAKVRVQYLPDETEQYIASIAGGKKPEFMTASSKRQRDFLDFADAEKVLPDPVQVADSRMVETDSLPPLKKQDSAKPAAKHNPFGEPTPLPERKRELGYVEDAFSVLDTMDSSHKAKFPEPAKDASPLIRNLKKVQKVDKPIYVQVASFSDKENAMSLAGKLSSISAVEVREVDVKGTYWYRVRLGPTYNQAVAEELQQRVADFGIKDARFVQD